jgi:hypothetical protein
MSFDILAPIYRLMERMLAGKKLHRCRCAFVDRVPAPQNILILGEGPGRFLVECVRRFPQASITCVEESAKMIAEARSNLARHQLSADRVTFIQSDAMPWLEQQRQRRQQQRPHEARPNEFELIVTHFFLDCFRADQLETLVPAIASVATKDAHWLLADFQQASRGWRRWRSRCILTIMYTFFRAVTRLPAASLTPPDPYLQRAGFSLRERQEYEWGLLKSDWWMRSE